MKEPILWNRLGSSTEVTNSVIGDNFTQNNGTFESGYFGNGYRSDANNEYVYATGLSTDLLTAGTLEIWLKPDWNHDDNSGVHYVLDGTTAGERFVFTFIDVAGADHDFIVESNGTTLLRWYPGVIEVGTWNFHATFSAGDWIQS